MVHADKAGKEGSGWMMSLIGLRQSCQEWCTWQKIGESSECSFMVSSKLHTEYDTHHGAGTRRCMCVDETGATPGWSSHGVVSLKAVTLAEREIMNVWRDHSRTYQARWRAQ